MKNKLQYIIIFILIISNVFLAYNLVNKKKHPKDNEFKSELSYLKNRLGFDKNQLLEAKKEYKRYSKEKRSKERRFRRLDLNVMNDLSENIDTNNINKDKYYEVAVALNKAKMEHWINIRKISNKEQVKKLDSIWLNMKKRIESRSQ
jgi:regulatory protein YycI of two-component signal transduction system YycFG